MKYTTHSLKRMEAIFKSAGFKIRYGKGQFKSGHCLLREQKTIVMNKFFSTEARIHAFIEMLPEIELSLLSEEDRLFLEKNNLLKSED